MLLYGQIWDGVTNKCLHCLTDEGTTSNLHGNTNTCAWEKVDSTSDRNSVIADSFLLSTAAWNPAPYLQITLFIHEKHSSMGLKLGEYGGKYMSLTSLRAMLENCELYKESLTVQHTTQQHLQHEELHNYPWWAHCIQLDRVSWPSKGQWVIPGSYHHQKNHGVIC